MRGYYTQGEYRIGAASDPALYYGIDQLGSVRRVFENASSAPAYDYDPWGHALQTTAPLADYGFAGMFNHAPSRLGLTWFRAYDPGTGRWVSRDPLGEMTDPAGNLYAYVGNDPLVLTDPLGLCISESTTTIDDEPSVPLFSEPPPPPLQMLAQTCGAYITENCKGSIHREFPGQFYDTEIDDVRGAAKAGDKDARKALKLMFDRRFRK